MQGPIFDDEFMNDMLLNPDLYGMENEEQSIDEEDYEEEYEDDEEE